MLLSCYRAPPERRIANKQEILLSEIELLVLANGELGAPTQNDVKLLVLTDPGLRMRLDENVASPLSDERIDTERRDSKFNAQREPITNTSSRRCPNRGYIVQRANDPLGHAGSLVTQGP